MIRYLLPILALGACAPAPLPDSGFDGDFGATAPAASFSAQRYECDTGQTLRAENNPTQAIVSLDDGTNIALSRVGGSSGGVQYAGGGYVWFVEGDRAVLTNRGGQANCRLSAL